MAGRKGITLGKTRGFLYQLAKFLGDLSAVSRGPAATGRHIARRGTGKATGKMLWRLFK